MEKRDRQGVQEERSGETGDERQELIVPTVEDEHTCFNGAISCTCFKGDLWFY